MMSEDKKSGIMPDKKIQPTIIGGGKKMTPTRIGQSENVKKPTTIGGEVSDKQKTPIKATTIIPTGINLSPEPEQGKSVSPTPAKIPSAPATVSSEKPKVVVKPSCFPGVVKKFLEVSSEELMKKFPGISQVIIEKIKSILKTICLDTLEDSECLNFGITHQERYAILVKENMDNSGNDNIQDANRHMMKLLSLLTDLAEEFSDKKRGLFRKNDPIGKFKEIYPELIQVSDILRRLIPVISGIQKKFLEKTEDFLELKTDLEAWSLSATHLSDLLQGQTDKQREIEILQQRGLALLQTQAQVQQGEVTRESFVNDIGSLVTKVNEAVLVKLPAWMEQIGTLSTKKSLTDTDLYQSRQSLDKIIQSFT